MIVVLDAKRMTDKETTHAYLKEVFDFPEYYGNNLDALKDCLEDIPNLSVVIMDEENAGAYYSQAARVLKRF